MLRLTDALLRLRADMQIAGYASKPMLVLSSLDEGMRFLSEVQSLTKIAIAHEWPVGEKVLHQGRDHHVVEFGGVIVAWPAVRETITHMHKEPSYTGPVGRTDRK